MRYAWFVGALALVACKDPALNVDGERVPSRAEGSRAPSAVATATATATSTAATKAPSKHGRGAAPITWDEHIAWKNWDEGSKLAQASNKPVFLLVYADWCPHCKNLKAVFDDPEIRALSEKLVMVHQDADDDDATWLTAKVGSYGTYVPRIFFLSPQGAVKPELTSGNGRYPYFYTPEGIEALKTSMRRAAGG